MGLKPEHHEELHVIMSKPMEFRRKRYVELRKEYINDTRALQQIDVYDIESLYHPHIIKFRDALLAGDKETQEIEETWIRKNYPDIK